MNNHQIDVVIPLLRNGSKNQDLELVYSLRSIEKNLTDYRNIIIVGDLPTFVNPETVIHIPFKDTPSKQANIKNKILAAFEVSTDQILFTNDDIFLLQPFSAPSYPYYYEGDLKDTSEKAARHFAYNELKEQNLPTKHFDIHAPIIYKKDLFIEAMRHFSDNSSIKSKYANYWSIEGAEIKDLKISSHLRARTIKQAIKDRAFFSIGDFGMNADMKMVLSELFPSPSKHELSNQQIKAA